LANKIFAEAQKPGGRHHGFYLQYRSSSIYIIHRALRSLRKRIEEHEDKLRYPEKYIPNFRTLAFQQQEALLNDVWRSEIERFQEQVAILEGILEERDRS
jgi:hypothetical protein